jgi:pSer/pThr/pTyr-binding forkhead associated (FHA) protein
LRDLGSRNGTLVNGTRLVDERLLSQGDRVQIGPLVFEVLLEEASSRSMVVGTQVPDDTYVSPENMTQTVRTTDFPSLDAPISAPEVKVNEPPPSSEKSSEQPAHGPREKGAGARP